MFPAGPGQVPLTTSSGFPKRQGVQSAGTKTKLGGAKIGFAMSCPRYFTSSEVNVRSLCVSCWSSFCVWEDINKCTYTAI